MAEEGNFHFNFNMRLSLNDNDDARDIDEEEVAVPEAAETNNHFALLAGLDDVGAVSESDNEEVTMNSGDSKENVKALEPAPTMHEKDTENSDLLEDSVENDENGSSEVEEFHCPVCFRLVVQPTTLSCGHTSCRVCLAQWYMTSKKKECPLCREAYLGHPKINTQLRNLLVNLAPNEMKMREKAMSEDNKGKKVVEMYEKEMSKEGNPKSTKKSDFIKSFCSGIFVALCSVVVVYLAWYWQNSESALLVRKPVQTWKSKDVESWLMDMPWAEPYARLAREQEIDGKFLLSLDVDSLQRVLNVTDEDQLKALMFAINVLKEQGVKMPVSLWDFKAIYPGRSLFLLYGLRYFPRTTVWYIQGYFYDELFLPFVRSGTHSDNSKPSTSVYEGIGIAQEIPEDSSTPVPPSAAMWSEFFVYFLFIPQYPVMLFAWQMFQHHTFTPIFVLLTAGVTFVHDVLHWKLIFLERKWRVIPSMFKSYVQNLMMAIIIMVLWPLIPKLVVDVLFYGSLYLSPLTLSVEAYHQIRHQWKAKERKGA